MEHESRVSLEHQATDQPSLICEATSGEDLPANSRIILRDWSARDFSNVYIRYRPTLVSQAARMLKDESLAEEIVQDSFLYLLTALPELDSEVGVLKFLRWKTRMLCLDSLRVPKIALASDFPNEEVFASEGVEPAEELTRADDAAIVQLALAKLTSRHRQVLIAKIYEEKSNAELASELGISENALRQITLRARNAFKRALVGEANLEGKTISDIISIAARRTSAARIVRLSSIGIAVLGLTHGLTTFLPPQDSQTISQIFSGPAPDGAIRNLGVEMTETSDSLEVRSPAPHLLPVEGDENGTVSRIDPVFANPSLVNEEPAINSDVDPESGSNIVLSGRDESGLFGVLNATLARNLEASATDLVTEISANSLSMKSDDGFSAYVSYDLNSEFVIQHLSLIYEFESESGPVRLTAAPLNSLEVTSHSAEGVMVVDYVASDLLFGDLDGIFGNESIAGSKLSRIAIQIQLQFADDNTLIGNSFELVPRI